MDAQKDLKEAIVEAHYNNTEHLYITPVDDHWYYERHEIARNNYREKCFKYPWDWLTRSWPNEEIPSNRRKFQIERENEQKLREKQELLQEWNKFKKI